MFDYFGFMPTEDRLVYQLSELYERYGYRKFCMAKFEEYSFYSDNRDFLSSEGVIAFNNSDGRLMALKPDITLSIVKNARIQKNSFTKAYYNENVYRISEQTHDYKEIKQMGVELLGDIDSYSLFEIISLAIKSLKSIDSDYILGVSHMAFIASVLSEMNVSASVKKQIVTCEKNKNPHDLALICRDNGIDDGIANYLASLTQLSGGFGDVLSSLRSIAPNASAKNACSELEAAYKALESVGLADKIHLDLSVANESSYYNGIIFNGYVKHSPLPVLSGGRYDNLAGKIRKGIGAVGFAVYLDNLNLYYQTKRENDCDILIINNYSQESEILIKAVERYISDGFSVRVEKEAPDNFNAGKTMYFDGKEVK